MTDTEKAILEECLNEDLSKTSQERHVPSILTYEKPKYLSRPPQLSKKIFKPKMSDASMNLLKEELGELAKTPQPETKPLKTINCESSTKVIEDEISSSLTSSAKGESMDIDNFNDTDEFGDDDDLVQAACEQELKMSSKKEEEAVTMLSER